MRVLLVEPPQADPAQPYSSLAVLLSAWRNAGLQVNVEDLNVDFYNYLCKPETIQNRLRTIHRRLAAPSIQDETELRVLQDAATLGDCIIDGVSHALRVMRDPELFYNPSTYAWAIRLLSRALDVVSAPYYPGRISLQSFKTAHSYLSSKGILASVEDERSNMFIRYCDEAARQKIVAHQPDILAVSVTFQTQIIPAWTLAKKVKTWLPGVRVVFGGATITRIKESLQKTPELFRDVDAFVLFEGETALPALIHEWEHEEQGLRAPNVMILTPTGIAASTKIHTEDMDLLNPPDHHGLPLDQYWWPEPALLINSSRGCYYGRCAFCMISPATWGPERMGRSYRLRSTENIIQDLIFAHQQTGAFAFNLANDILPPKALEEIGEALSATDLPITWDSEIRLERGLSRRVLSKMAEGGCRHLRFGFETASARVAKLMDKGTDLAATQRILKDCRDFGITVSLLCQVCFPGETLQEAQETLEFLQRNNDLISCVSLTQFVLERGSKVFQEPERFGVTIRPIPEQENLSWMYNYTHSLGTDSQKAILLYEQVEATLDNSYPDRDLFFKGGLGHAHTSLYTRRYSSESFLAWNIQRQRRAIPLDDHFMLRLPKGLLIRPEKDLLQDESKFTVGALEIPELLATIDGSALLILAPALVRVSTRALVDWIRYLSGNQYSLKEAATVLNDFYEAGLLLADNTDKRLVTFI